MTLIEETFSVSVCTRRDMRRVTDLMRSRHTFTIREALLGQLSSGSSTKRARVHHPPPEPDHPVWDDDLDANDGWKEHLASESEAIVKAERHSKTTEWTLVDVRKGKEPSKEHKEEHKEGEEKKKPAESL